MQARTNDARTLIDTAPRRGLAAVESRSLARPERRHEVQGRLKEAVETFDRTRMRGCATALGLGGVRCGRHRVRIITLFQWDSMTHARGHDEFRVQFRQGLYKTTWASYGRTATELRTHGLGGIARRGAFDSDGRRNFRSRLRNVDRTGWSMRDFTSADGLDLPIIFLRFRAGAGDRNLLKHVWVGVAPIRCRRSKETASEFFTRQGRTRVWMKQDIV